MNLHAMNKAPNDIQTKEIEARASKLDTTE